MMRLMILMSLSSLGLVGCATTYELSPVPPGHPASTEASDAPAQKSQTLARAEPVDPQAARSEHWAQRGQENGHGSHGDHEMMQEEHRPAESETEPDHDQHHDHQAGEAQPHGEHDPEEPAEAERAAPAVFDDQLGQVLRSYFDVAGALAEDDFEVAQQAMQQMQVRLDEVDAEDLNEAQRERWEQVRKPLSRGIDRFLAAGGIEPARTAFEPVSNELETVVRQFGSGDVQTVHVMHCPMAFGNRGADWLQPMEQVNNPYYGARMLRCGEGTETIAEGDAEAPEQEQQQEQDHEAAQGGHDHH